MTYSIRNEFSQFKILTRHFFQRFFQNDVVDFSDKMQEKIIAVLSILTIFSGLLASSLLYKYDFVPDMGTSWREKSFMIAYVMLVMGFVAVLEWDLIYLDIRDYKNLIFLPIRVRTIFIAKFTSLCLFVGMFVLALNSFSTIVFIIYLPHFQSASIFYIVGFGLVHLLIMTLASFFAFFLNIFFMGLFAAFLGYKLFNRISSYIRAFFIVFYITIPFFIFRVASGNQVLSSIVKFHSSSAGSQNFKVFFPPLWFTDLYETMIGNPNLSFHGVLNFAWLGLLLTVVVFYLTTGLSYSRHLKNVGIRSGKAAPLKKFKLKFLSIFNQVFLRNPTQRAVFYFYGKTLKSSMFHKMRLTTYVAMGVGFILALLATQDKDPSRLLVVNKTMLSIPHIMSFFLLLGLRGIVNIPTTLSANWIFKLTERKKIGHYFSGLKKGIVFWNLIPLFLVMLIGYWLLWNNINAFYHSIYGLAVSWLVMEVFFFNYYKIPYACSYLPGKEKVQLLWVFYLLMYLTYINLICRIELELLRTPANFPFFYGILLLIILCIRFYSWFFIYKKISLKYVEEPEPVMVGLGYETPQYKRTIT